MLGISAVRGGAEGYYLDAVAEGIDEYYRGVGEAPGWWTGSLADDLGLDGELAAGDLKAIWSGRHPGTLDPIAAFAGREIGGFDLCWRAPKSVSLLFAFADPHISRIVRDAHDRAVAAAFAYVEANAAGTRTGHAGAHLMPVEGLAAAMFRHRTSRTGDPHLHTHVLVANMAPGLDGKWRTLDGRLLFHHAKTAGYLYQAHLRHELTATLGVEWGFVTNGTADLAGIDRQVIDAFSERRRQILEHLDATGFSSARAAQIATLETRPTRPSGAEGSIREVWDAKAIAVGFDPGRLAHVIDRGRYAPARAGLHVDLERRLLGSSGLTHNQSTFDRRDVIQAIAQSAQHGATATDIEGFADQLLCSPAIVALGPSPKAVGGTRYSTVQMLELEHRLVDQATDRQLSGVGVVAPAWIEHVLASRPTITAEQVEMVERLCCDGDGVAVVSAPAGTGKTYALGAAREAWIASGHRVVGTAVAAKAARELERSAGIQSETLTRLTAGLAQGTLRFDHRTVLVVDEAGMAGTRQLAPFLDAAHQAGAKVVLVGDPRQLPAIQAGGLLNGLTHRLDPIELDTNRRQTHPWEHDALRQLRAGDVDVALDTYRHHDRIHTHETPAELVRAIVDDAWANRSTGAEVLIVALRRSDVDAINQRFRRRLAAAGELHGQPLFVHGNGYQIGDQVLCLRNDYRLDVRNGDRGTITAIDHNTGTIDITTPDGGRRLSWDYLDAGHIDHGYATTIHKAQGATVDHCYLYANDTLYRQAAYVALSRGRHTNHIHTLGQLTIEPDLTHAPTPRPARPHDLVRDAFHRQTDNDLAIDTPTPRPTHQPPARSTPADDLGIGL